MPRTIPQRGRDLPTWVAWFYVFACVVVCYVVVMAGDGLKGWLVRLIGIVLLLVDNQCGVLIVAVVGVNGVLLWLMCCGCWGLRGTRFGHVM